MSSFFSKDAGLVCSFTEKRINCQLFFKDFAFIWGRPFFWMSSVSLLWKLPFLGMSKNKFADTFWTPLYLYQMQSSRCTLQKWMCSTKLFCLVTIVHRQISWENRFSYFSSGKIGFHISAFHCQSHIFSSAEDTDN